MFYIEALQNPEMTSLSLAPIDLVYYHQCQWLPPHSPLPCQQPLTRASVDNYLAQSRQPYQVLVARSSLYQVLLSRFNEHGNLIAEEPQLTQIDWFSWMLPKQRYQLACYQFSNHLLACVSRRKSTANTQERVRSWIQSIWYNNITTSCDFQIQFSRVWKLHRWHESNTVNTVVTFIQYFIYFILY